MVLLEARQDCCNFCYYYCCWFYCQVASSFLIVASTVQYLAFSFLISSYSCSLYLFCADMSTESFRLSVSLPPLTDWSLLPPYICAGRVQLSSCWGFQLQPRFPTTLLVWSSSSCLWFLRVVVFAKSFLSMLPVRAGVSDSYKFYRKALLYSRW